MGSDIMKEVDDCIYERQARFKDRVWIFRGASLEPLSCGKHDYCYKNKSKLQSFSE
jgi:hypothetical protein